MSLSSVSEEETTEESDIMESTDAQLEIVSECWIEPQAGVVSHDASDDRPFFRGLDYTGLAESVSPHIIFNLPVDKHKTGSLRWSVFMSSSNDNELMFIYDWD